MPVLSPVHEKVPAGADRRPPVGAVTARRGPSARHLVQRPLTREEFLLGSAVPEQYRFVLFDDLSLTEPRFGAIPDLVDGLHFVAQTTGEVARFVAHHHLGIPKGRRSHLVTRASVEITDIEPWRLRGSRGQAVMDLDFRSLRSEGASGLVECSSAVTVDGVPCATARAYLLFSEPTAARPAGQPRLLAEDLRRVVPARVGRTDGRDVVVHGRLVVHEHRVLMDVVPHPGNPVFDPERSDRACAALLIEASRQAATLAVGELRGLSAAHCLPTSWAADLDGGCDRGLPLRCSAVPGTLTRDAQGRPVVPVRIEFTQNDRCVGTVAVRVLQDC